MGWSEKLKIAVTTRYFAEDVQYAKAQQIDISPIARELFHKWVQEQVGVKVLKEKEFEAMNEEEKKYFDRVKALKASLGLTKPSAKANMDLLWDQERKESYLKVVEALVSNYNKKRNQVIQDMLEGV